LIVLLCLFGVHFNRNIMFIWRAF